MSNFAMLVTCLLVGLLLRRSGRLPDNAHMVLNAIILHVSLPAVTLRYLHDFRFDSADALWPVLMPWVLFVIGAALFYGVGRYIRLPAASVGALTLVGGLGNTSFVGLPMIEALHGSDGMGLGLLIDQLGSYLALSTLGILATAIYAAEGQASPREMARRVLTFPPFIAMVLALALIPVPFPAVLDQMLERIGDTLAPLALLSVGMQLRLEAVREHLRPLCLGLGYKLLMCPAMVVGLLWLGGAESRMVSRVTVIEAAMPPMIGAAVVASQANLAPRLVSLMIGVGHPDWAGNGADVALVVRGACGVSACFHHRPKTQPESQKPTDARRKASASSSKADVHGLTVVAGSQRCERCPNPGTRDGPSMRYVRPWPSRLYGIACVVALF